MSRTPLINFSPVSMTEKTVLTIPACLGLKMKTKEKWSTSVKLLTKYVKNA